MRLVRGPDSVVELSTFRLTPLDEGVESEDERAGVTVTEEEDAARFEDEAAAADADDDG